MPSIFAQRIYFSSCLSCLQNIYDEGRITLKKSDLTWLKEEPDVGHQLLIMHSSDESQAKLVLRDPGALEDIASVDISENGPIVEGLAEEKSLQIKFPVVNSTVNRVVTLEPSVEAHNWTTVLEALKILNMDGKNFECLILLTVNVVALSSSSSLVLHCGHVPFCLYLTKKGRPPRTRPRRPRAQRVLYQTSKSIPFHGTAAANREAGGGPNDASVNNKLQTEYERDSHCSILFIHPFLAFSITGLVESFSTRATARVQSSSEDTSMTAV